MSSKNPRARPNASARPTDWREYRPAIWMAMVGVAVILLVNPVWIGAVPLGGSIGVALRIRQRRRRRVT